MGSAPKEQPGENRQYSGPNRFLARPGFWAKAEDLPLSRLALRMARGQGF